MIAHSSGSRDVFSQQPKSRKINRRNIQRIFSYILPSRLFASRGRRRTRAARPTGHSGVAYSSPNVEPARIQSRDRLSTQGLEALFPGNNTPILSSIEQQRSLSETAPPPKDDRSQYEEHEVENCADDPVTLSPSSGYPSTLVSPIFTGSCLPIASHPVGTGQITPLTLDDDNTQTPGVISRSTSIVSISIDAIEEMNWFVEPAYITRPDGTKGGVLMSLDTQSRRSLLSVERWRALKLKMEQCNESLRPFRTVSSSIGKIIPHGIVKNVEWHIAGHMRTNTSNFLVVDTPDFDAILGQNDIARYRILERGRGLDRHAVVRTSIDA